jgi:HD superfamily phosphohydrolase
MRLRYDKLKKIKIIHDPVYGFITIPSDFIFDIVQHRYVQRLRYIKQVSMTHLVYPGALHTRFHHALGAMHLMGLALDTLQSKDISISPEEREAAMIAILLHDVGHGPFSHSLECTLVEEVSHELISSLLMDNLDQQYGGKLQLAKAIFNNQYSKKFLHQLVSSQLDTDRMDYLNRDSFFTGVSEGVISFDRIIKMFNVVDNQLVVEQKGIYSVEKFLIARRLMYWQVYLHKTVLSAEGMLIQILKRAKELYQFGEALPVSPSLEHFLRHRLNRSHFENEQIHLQMFSNLDDVDILAAIKCWMQSADPVLKDLCGRLMNRNLYHTELMDAEPGAELLGEIQALAKKELMLSDDVIQYYVWAQEVVNSAYDQDHEPIQILMKDGMVQDISKASDLSNVEVLSKKVKKYAITFPKELLKRLDLNKIN